MFLAKADLTWTSGGVAEKVLVKIVQGNYGYEAHKITAESGFSPKLFGMAKLDGVPTAYAMELLSGSDDWQHLHHRFIYTPTLEHFEKLKDQIDQFLALMEKHNLVHGDLRANNIFIRVDGKKVELRVLDWDWAGVQGTVRYPLDRNPAGLISAVHGRAMFTKVFEQLKAQSGR